MTLVPSAVQDSAIREFELSAALIRSYGTEILVPQSTGKFVAPNDTTPRKEFAVTSGSADAGVDAG
ncbi:hypothetical protein B2J88_09320 [Rhodococcus sp. SRB_17]|nr:hypothetical protein [Rhodococcus sp. SRB_17]